MGAIRETINFGLGTFAAGMILMGSNYLADEIKNPNLANYTRASLSYYMALGAAACFKVNRRKDSPLEKSSI